MYGLVHLILGRFSFARSANESTYEYSLRIQLKMCIAWHTIFILACLSQLCAAQEPLVFATSSNPWNDAPSTTTVPLLPTSSNLVLVNNVRVPGGLTPFVPTPAPTQEFFNCYYNCPTTPQYNPICGSDRQLYMNEEKFNCARNCGADIQIVRRGSCEGLFTMTRG